MKTFSFLTLIIALLYTLSSAQNRRPAEYLRETDNSRRREEPVQQERQRPIDEGGKERIIPRQPDPPQQRPVDRWIDKPDPPKQIYPEPVYVEVAIDSPPYFDQDDEVYIPAPKIIHTTEKEEALEMIADENYINAIDKLTRSILKNPKDLELYYLRGIAETGAVYYDEAIEDFDYYLKFFDEDGEAYYRRGLAKFFNHQKNEARKDFELAITFEFDKANQIIKKYY